MAKITRPRLARGTKLVKEHLEQSVGTVAVKVGTAAVAREHLAKSRGVVRLNLHVPVLDSDYFRMAVYGRTTFCIPFTLAALQDVWDSSGIFGPTSPPFVLDEFGVSFDTRREPAAIADRFHAAGAEGKLNYDGLGAYTFDVSLMEKSQRFFNTNASLFPEKDVLAMRLSAEQVSGRHFRANPFLLPDCGKQLYPYKTYLLVVNAPELYDAITRCALVSLTFTLKMLVPLVDRDDSSVNPQNIPSPWVGDKVARAVAQHAIVGDDTLQEQDVQDNMVEVDQRVLRRLEGGYTREGLPPATQELAQDSCYDIIAVPMWSNFGEARAIRAEDVTALDVPYVGAHPCAGKTCDERVIPLNFPFVIHHVVAGVSYASPRGDSNGLSGSLHPRSATFVSEVEVLAQAAQRGDDVTSTPIAYTKWTPNIGAFPKDNILIDRIKAQPRGLNSEDTTEPWDYELLAVPLRGAGGLGYFPQGRPVFVGRTNFGGASRSNIAAAPPPTMGRETVLLVRWAMQDTAGMADASAVPPGAANFAETYVGYSGHWVYLIGKKSLVGAERDVPA